VSLTLAIKVLIFLLSTIPKKSELNNSTIEEKIKVQSKLAGYAVVAQW
jgi:hypothetical protein